MGQKKPEDFISHFVKVKWCFNVRVHCDVVRLFAKVATCVGRIRILWITCGSCGGARSVKSACCVKRLVDLNRFTGCEPLKQKSFNPSDGFTLLIFTNQGTEVFAESALATFPYPIFDIFPERLGQRDI